MRLFIAINFNDGKTAFIKRCLDNMARKGQNLYDECPVVFEILEKLKSLYRFRGNR